MSSEHDYDGHGGHAPGCRMCRAEQAESALAAATERIAELERERDGQRYVICLYCDDWKRTYDSKDPDSRMTVVREMMAHDAVCPANPHRARAAAATERITELERELIKVADISNSHAHAASRMEREAEAATERIAELEHLAYLGEHHFPDLTYKARLEELVPQYRAAQERIAELGLFVEQERGRTEQQVDVLKRALNAATERERALREAAEEARRILRTTTGMDAMRAYGLLDAAIAACPPSAGTEPTS